MQLIREDFSLPFLKQLKQVLRKECASLPMDLKCLLGAHIKPLEQSIDLSLIHILTTDVLLRICNALDCDIEEIVECIVQNK